MKTIILYLLPFTSHLLPLTFYLLPLTSYLFQDRPVGGPCDQCDLMFYNMPKESDMRSETSVIPKDEPGEPLIMEGTIFKKDGKTPAPGIILYVYQTDAKGYYSNLPGERNIQHGHLRGWIKTGVDGKYKFTTIRPAPYPERNAPAHIHPQIKEPGLTRYYIDEYLFEGDPLLTAEEKNKQEKRGGNGIISLTKKDGVWRGKRDIILGLNIPNYE
jgi:protocatechuate 3,4-dioxygenase, beta subunit